MAPRAPKPKPDDADRLKPKTEKAKVEKVKPEKTAKVEKKESVKGKAEKTDKGEKTKAVTGDEAMELIAAYLKAQNRPYSATEVSANLHGKVSLPRLPPQQQRPS
jgi:26S proteasome regulatory subunit (ATPase 3-interacting protein)